MKISRVKTALCLTAALAVSSGALLPASAAVKDGTYLANVSLHNQMFRIYEEDNSTCRLTVKNGRMTALIRLNGTGYDRLYAGTKENAPADSAGAIEAVTDGEGLYTYRVPVKALDQEMTLAAHSKKYDRWYDRTLSFSLKQPGSLRAVSPKKHLAKVSWKKVNWDEIEAAQKPGYELQYGLKKNLKGGKTLIVKKAGTTVKTIRGLKSGKKYYFRIRSTRQNTAGTKTANFAWSSVKAVRVR